MPKKNYYDYDYDYVHLISLINHYPANSQRSKCSRTKQTKFHIRAARKWGESKKVEGTGWGRGKKGTLARKPLDFEKRPLAFTVEFINFVTKLKSQ